MNSTEREYYARGEHLGIGFDSFQEKFLSTAINCENIKEEELRKRTIEFSSEIQYSFEHIQSKSDLCKSFSLSGSISGALPTGIGALSGHVKGQYFSNKNIKFDNLCILLNYQIKNQAYRIKNPELSTSAKNFLESFGPTEFRKKFGDEFIIGFRTGAEYMALIEVLSVEKDEQEKKYLDIKTSISNMFHEIEVGSQLNNEDKKKLQELNTNISCFKKGAKISDNNSMILTFEQMIHDFQDFQKNVKESGGVEYTAIFADYEQLLDIKHTILTPELIELKHYINQLKFQKIKYQEELLDIENKLRFKETEYVQSFEDIKKIKNKIYKIESYIRECYQNPDFIKPKELIRYLQGNIPEESLVL